MALDSVRDSDKSRGIEGSSSKHDNEGSEDSDDDSGDDKGKKETDFRDGGADNPTSDSGTHGVEGSTDDEDNVDGEGNDNDNEHSEKSDDYAIYQALETNFIHDSPLKYEGNEGNEGREGVEREDGKGEVKGGKGRKGRKTRDHNISSPPRSSAGCQVPAAVSSGAEVCSGEYCGDPSDDHSSQYGTLAGPGLLVSGTIDKVNTDNAHNTGNTGNTDNTRNTDNADNANNADSRDVTGSIDNKKKSAVTSCGGSETRGADKNRITESTPKNEIISKNETSHPRATDDARGLHHLHPIDILSSIEIGLIAPESSPGKKPMLMPVKGANPSTVFPFAFSFCCCFPMNNATL